ncbi:uncharacterized protein [Macrobrachium rosenbergii]|uniref:uncharacterized protein n=1 Tax=Macrobrachium rosenbergii TaxID=79674 RepID=UPI0034D6D311
MCNIFSKSTESLNSGLRLTLCGVISSTLAPTSERTHAPIPGEGRVSQNPVSLWCPKRQTRYLVLHPPGSEEWTLHIKFTQLGDGGWYECQVNSDPKITRQVLLLVKDKSLNDPFYEPEFEILDNRTQVQVEGPSERYMQQGSILSLVCSIRHKGVRGPDLVMWFHGAVRLHYDSPRGGIALQTEKTSDRTVSRLRLSNVTPQDSGRYSCRPDTGGISSVSVHIQSSQHHAAVQHNTHNSGVTTSDSSKSSVALQFFLLASGHAVIASHFR